MKYLLGALMMAAVDAVAADDVKSIPAAAPDFMSGEYLLQVALSFVVVIALMVAMLWFLRRMNGLTGSSNGVLRVLASVSLGQRERAVLIAVGEKQMLLGIAPGSVRTLHVFDEPVVTPDGPQSAVTMSFGAALKQAISATGSKQP